MGFLSKLLARKAEHPKETTSQPNFPSCNNEQELIEIFGGTSLEKQISFGEVIGDSNWNVDMTKEEISFGANLIFPIQVLGTYSHSSKSWLWAWANTKSGLSGSVLKQSFQLKKYGEENNIDLLRNSEFDATTDDLHLIGLIASGIFNSSSYYIADYGQGAMVVTITNSKVDKKDYSEHHRILTTFPRLISEFDMNHNTALTNYLVAKGYNILENGIKLKATKNENTITAEFDEQSRLTKIIG